MGFSLKFPFCWIFSVFCHWGQFLMGATKNWKLRLEFPPKCKANGAWDESEWIIMLVGKPQYFLSSCSYQRCIVCMPQVCNIYIWKIWKKSNKEFVKRKLNKVCNMKLLFQQHLCADDAGIFYQNVLERGFSLPLRNCTLRFVKCDKKLDRESFQIALDAHSFPCSKFFLTSLRFSSKLICYFRGAWEVLVMTQNNV